MAHPNELEPESAATAHGTVDYDRQEPNSGLIAVFGIVTIVTLVGIVLGIQYYYENVYERKVRDQQLSQVGADIQTVRAKEAGLLDNGYALIDEAKGVYRIPIARAMELVAEEAKQGKTWYPAKSTPVLPPQPAAPATPPAGATNATSGNAQEPALTGAPGTPAVPVAPQH